MIDTGGSGPGCSVARVPAGVAVVAFGSSDLLQQALSPLLGRNTVVIDNSSDARVAAVCASAGVRYLDPGANLGFGAGVNRAISALWDRGPCDVLVLNPDAVLQPAALARLEQALAADSNLALVSPMLRSPDGSSQRVTWNWPSPISMWREALGLGRWNDKHRDWLTGAVMLIRADAWRQVGLFDERFFLYQEETDWQRRATLAGWTTAVVDSATAHHVGAGTSLDGTGREVLFHAGTETYIRKWYGSRGWFWYRAAAIVGGSVRGVVLRGSRGRAARRRVSLYWRGPRATAGLD